jgi:hypothetical protein
MASKRPITETLRAVLPAAGGVAWLYRYCEFLAEIHGVMHLLEVGATSR